jgi:hypothetical protein
MVPLMAGSARIECPRCSRAVTLAERGLIACRCGAGFKVDNDGDLIAEGQRGLAEALARSRARTPGRRQ